MMTMNTHTRICKPVAMLLASGVAIGFCSTAHARPSAELIVQQLNQGGFNSVAAGQDLALYGVLRDFSSSHPDFGLSGGAANGQYAGNISFFADSDRKPVYVGNGNPVNQQWLNTNGLPIAPHLYSFTAYNSLPEGVGSYVTGSYSLGQSTLIDSWNSNNGTYLQTVASNALIGVQNAGANSISLGQSSNIDGSILIGPGGNTTAVMAGQQGTLSGTVGNLQIAPNPLQVVAPADIGPSIGDTTYNSNITISTDMHYNKLKIGSNKTMTISGQRTIVCDDQIDLGQNSQIQLAPGATLEIYTTNGKANIVGQDAQINSNTMDPTRVTIFHLSPMDLKVSQDADVYAMIYAPNANVIIGQDGDIYGRVLASDVSITQGGGLHLDEGLAVTTNACGFVINDTAGSYSGAHNGGIQDILSFRQWFRNVPGVNASTVTRLPMADSGAGDFTYGTPDFTIADDLLFGNQGDANNRYFTYEMTAVGQYNMCSSQFFSFTGDGDVWVMINDKLVIDLGGLGNGKFQIADMDRMGMSDGELFVFRFFYAQRTGAASAFSMRTNINFVFSDAAIPITSGLFD